MALAVGDLRKGNARVPGLPGTNQGGQGPGSARRGVELHLHRCLDSGITRHQKPRTSLLSVELLPCSWTHLRRVVWQLMAAAMAAAVLESPARVRVQVHAQQRDGSWPTDRRKKM